MIAAAPFVGSLILGNVMLGAILPYIITAAVVGIASLIIAAGYGDQHQRGLHEFVLDDAFLSPNIATLSK